MVASVMSCKCVIAIPLTLEIKGPARGLLSLKRFRCRAVKDWMDVFGLEYPRGVRLTVITGERLI